DNGELRKLPAVVLTYDILKDGDEVYLALRGLNCHGSHHETGCVGFTGDEREAAVVADEADHATLGVVDDAGDVGDLHGQVSARHGGPAFCLVRWCDLVVGAGRGGGAWDPGELLCPGVPGPAERTQIVAADEVGSDRVVPPVPDPQPGGGPPSAVEVVGVGGAQLIGQDQVLVRHPRDPVHEIDPGAPAGRHVAGGVVDEVEVVLGHRLDDDVDHGTCPFGCGGRLDHVVVCDRAVRAGCLGGRDAPVGVDVVGVLGYRSAVQRWKILWSRRRSVSSMVSTSICSSRAIWYLSTPAACRR